jgi:hypothetical protein
LDIPLLSRIRSLAIYSLSRKFSKILAISGHERFIKSQSDESITNEFKMSFVIDSSDWDFINLSCPEIANILENFLDRLYLGSFLKY